MKIAKTKTRYLSDEDDDFAILERAIEQGLLGEMADLDLARFQQNRSPTVEEIIEWSGGNGKVEDAQKDVDEYNKWVTRLPTRFDSPWMHMVLSELVSEILDAAHKRELEVKNLPKVATLPTGEVNASAVSLHGASCPFLLFDSGLPDFCNLASKAWLQFFPRTSITEDTFRFEYSCSSVREHLSSEGGQGILRMKELLSAMIQTGRPRLAPPYPPPQVILEPLEEMRAIMEALVTGHELAHYIHGDIDLKLTTLARKRVGDQQALSQDHLEEYRADGLGVLLALDVGFVRGTYFFQAYMACECWFATMMLLRRLESDFCPSESPWKDETSVTHPSWFDRRGYVRHMMFLWYQKDEERQEIMKVIAFVDCVLDEVWEFLRRSRA